MIITPISIQTPNKDIVPLTSPVGVGNSVSNTNNLPGVEVAIGTQFPQFVSEDHPEFIQFMEAYYSWLNSKGLPLHDARRLLDNQDIDTISTEYERGLFNEFLAILPQNFVGDRSIVLKNIKQFYGAKGTEKSFKFLFRILFNSDSYLYYPKVDILRASDGKWIQNKTVRLTNVVGDIKRLRAQKIRGRTTNTVAFVERLYGINLSTASAHELILNSVSITGTFEPGEIVECQAADENGNVTIITGKITPIVAKVKVIRSGANYSLGDTFPIQDAYGQGAIIRVSEIDENGAILQCNVKEYGIGYNVNNPPFQVKLLNSSHPETTTQSSGLNPDVAVVNLILGSTTDYPGYFRNADGQLSTNKYIHDGYFYQQYSYVTFTDKSYNEYVEVMNRAVHPIGFKHFGGLSIVTSGATTVKRGNEYTHIKQTFVKELDAGAKSKTAIVIPILRNKNTNHLGPSYESIVRDKFSYKPFIKYDANREIMEQPYYGTGLTGKKSSTPVSTFELQNVGVNKPKDIETNRKKRIRLFPDSCIVQNPDRLVVNTQHELSKNFISVPQGTTSVDVGFSIINSTGNNYTWIAKKNGVTTIQQGTATSNGQITVTLAADNCRVAIFVTDDMGRTYKSDNVVIKIME